jgi:hypothetical protein
MTEENNNFPISRVLLILSVLSFVLMMGGCCSCIGSLKTEYGEEEFYRKPGGGIGYGAKSNTTGGNPTLAVIGGVVGFLSLFGSGIASGFEQRKQAAEGKRKGEQLAAERKRKAEQLSAEEKERAERLASMSLNELEYLLEDIKKQREFADVSSVATAEERNNLMKEETKISDVLRLRVQQERKSWELSLSSLSIEQLEKQLNEFRLITNPTQEDKWQQMILAKVIEKHRTH